MRGSILVVDDDAAVRGLIVRILKSWGHVVISEAGSVAEALTCAEGVAILDAVARVAADDHRR